MITQFEKEIVSTIIRSMSNNYNDNYDFYRFGEKEKVPFSFKNYIKNKYIIKKFIPKNKTIYAVEQTFDLIEKYGNKLSSLYEILHNNESKELLVDIIAYRILGEEKIKLPTNTDEFWKQCKESIEYSDKTDVIDLNFLNWKLFKTNYRKYNLPLDIYSIPQSMVEYCYLGHYTYTSLEKKICVEQGDYVLDCGGCYGDTALIFGQHAGIEGRVYSFEFIPSNIDIFNKNLSLNRNLNNIEIVRNPLWEKSDIKYYFKDDGPSSNISADPFEGSEGEVNSLSIDDFVKSNSIPKINFIKMDIEGAELPSLRGAVNTLRVFKPKLAISIYHSMNDFVDIPEYLNSLELGYKFFLGHYTIHAEETVLYAIAE